MSHRMQDVCFGVLPEASEQDNRGMPAIDLRRALAPFALALVVLFAWPAPAQTFTVLHTFTGGLDGAFPYAGLTLDRAGNLYGSASSGGFAGNGCAGNGGCGAIFQLTHSRGRWIFSPIYAFQGGTDGESPRARVVVAPDGSLDSTTWEGGTSGAGTVFSLQPPPEVCKTVLCLWPKTTLYQFKGTGDGALPEGALTFDVAGNIYGVGSAGGSQHLGTVYKLTRSGSVWTESVLNNQLPSPETGVVFDRSGNLYGTTDAGGTLDLGTVYQLTPSGSGWTLSTVSSFQDLGDGGGPLGGLIVDGAGNLYGTTSFGGNNGGGTVFELTDSHGAWTMKNLYSFVQTGVFGPTDSLVMDAAGNLYGTTNEEGANSYGNVFKLTRGNGGWTYTDLYDFTGGSDGAYPSGVTLDGSGNLYGTAANGGGGPCNHGCGVVWEITP